MTNPTYSYDNLQYVVKVTKLDYTTPAFPALYSKFRIELKSVSPTHCVAIVHLVDSDHHVNHVLSVKVKVVLDLRHTDGRKICNKSMEFEALIKNSKTFKIIQLVPYPIVVKTDGSIWIKAISVRVDEVPGSSKSPQTIPNIAAMLNVPAFSDVSLLPEGSIVTMKASRLVLSQASVFFHTMFAGVWAETCQPDKPVQLSFSSKAVFLCLIHVYAGWLPGNPLPTLGNIVDLMKQISFAESDLDFDLMHEVVLMAKMLDLTSLAIDGTEELIKLLHLDMAALKRIAV